MFYLTTGLTHFLTYIYMYTSSGMLYITIQITREKTHCPYFIGYSFQLAERDLLYAPFHGQDSTYHGLSYNSCGSLAGTVNCSVVVNKGSGMYCPARDSVYKGSLSARQRRLHVKWLQWDSSLVILFQVQVLYCFKFQHYTISNINNNIHIYRVMHMMMVESD